MSLHFGDDIRDIVSASCGTDLRAARSRTPLPGIESTDIRRRLASNLEHAFDITLSDEDVAHLTTLRAVLQCVRLRRWEREARLHDAADQPRDPVTDTPPSSTLRERFVRYTPASSVPMPVAASFAARKS